MNQVIEKVYVYDLLFYWYAFFGFGWKGVFYIGVFRFLRFGGPSS